MENPKMYFLLGPKTVLTSTGLQTTQSQWCCIEPRMEISVNSCIPIAKVYLVSTKGIFISKESYGYGESKNVFPQSVQTPYLHVRAWKQPRFMRSSIGPTMEICVNSGLPIAMIPRLHQCNVYIRRKLQLWRAQKCFPLLGAKTVPTSMGLQSTPVLAGQYIGLRMEIYLTSGLPIGKQP